MNDCRKFSIAQHNNKRNFAFVSFQPCNANSGSTILKVHESKGDRPRFVVFTSKNSNLTVEWPIFPLLIVKSHSRTLHVYLMNKSINLVCTQRLWACVTTKTFDQDNPSTFPNLQREGKNRKRKKKIYIFPLDFFASQGFEGKSGNAYRIDRFLTIRFACNKQTDGINRSIYMY